MKNIEPGHLKTELNLGVVSSFRGKAHLIYGPDGEGCFATLCEAEKAVYIGVGCLGAELLLKTGDLLSIEEEFKTQLTCLNCIKRLQSSKPLPWEAL